MIKYLPLLCVLLTCCSSETKRLSAVKTKYPTAEVVIIPDWKDHFLIRCDNGDIFITDTSGDIPKPGLRDEILLLPGPKAPIVLPDLEAENGLPD